MRPGLLAAIISLLLGSTAAFAQSTAFTYQGKLTDGGKRRMLTLKDGGVIVEKLIKRDDAHRAYSYKIISSPLPVAAYQSTISVMDGKDGGSQLKWSGKYLAKGAASADAKKTIDGIYQAGADVLVKP